MHLTKEEAIAFAKKYLADRLDDVTDPYYDTYSTACDVWEECVDSVLNDIIPYLYGEALD